MTVPTQSPDLQKLRELAERDRPRAYDLIERKKKPTPAPPQGLLCHPESWAGKLFAAYLKARKETTP